MTLRGADKQQDVAEIADGSVQSIQALSEAVKKSAGSLTSKNSESQVMLLTSVKDVAAALNDLLQARKSMSGSKKDEETIAKPGQVERMLNIIYFIFYIKFFLNFNGNIIFKEKFIMIGDGKKYCIPHKNN